MTPQEVLNQIDQMIAAYTYEVTRHEIRSKRLHSASEISAITANLSASISAIEISGFILELKMLRNRVELLNPKEK